mmetsp:Transcript_7858/g.7108  ORF Transcript_7858/g.7108 Transcript_7858/m.7108 type:complete len:93 (-) Transcript_7858:386-664(-)
MRDFGKEQIVGLLVDLLYLGLSAFLMYAFTPILDEAGNNCGLFPTIVSWATEIFYIVFTLFFVVTDVYDAYLFLFADENKYPSGFGKFCSGC